MDLNPIVSDTTRSNECLRKSSPSIHNRQNYPEHPDSIQKGMFDGSRD